MPVGNFQPTPLPTSVTSSSTVPTRISQGNCSATYFSTCGNLGPVTLQGSIWMGLSLLPKEYFNWLPGIQM